MKPSGMTMNMYMLDIMYAPANWVTLMVMPMWIIPAIPWCRAH